MEGNIIKGKEIQVKDGEKIPDLKPKTEPVTEGSLIKTLKEATQFPKTEKNEDGN